MKIVFNNGIAFLNGSPVLSVHHVRNFLKHNIPNQIVVNHILESLNKHRSISAGLGNMIAQSTIAHRRSWNPSDSHTVFAHRMFKKNNHSGGLTIAYSVENDHIVYGYARCRECDHFCKKTGREIALEMLKENPQLVHVNEFKAYLVNKLIPRYGNDVVVEYEHLYDTGKVADFLFEGLMKRSN